MSDWDVLSLIHGKLIGCSNDAVATFWRVVTWARGPGAKARPGFVNRAQLRHWSGGLSKKRFEEVVVELVDAGKPQHAHGLLDPAEGGWWIHGFEDYGQTVDIVAPLAPIPVAAPAARSAVSEARAAAGRAGGLRSAEQRADPSKQTPQGKQTPKQTDASGQANTQANTAVAEGSSFGSGSPSGSLNPENTKETPLPKDLEAQRAGGVCLDEDDYFLKLERSEQARLILDDKKRFAPMLRPHRWPEVMELAAAFAKATKRGRGVSEYNRDGGVRALVALLAAFDVETLLRAMPFAVTSAWWLEEANRPLACLSATVIENALSAAAREASVTAMIERAEAATGVKRVSRSSPPPTILLVGGPT